MRGVTDDEPDRRPRSPDARPHRRAVLGVDPGEPARARRAHRRRRRPRLPPLNGNIADGERDRRTWSRRPELDEAARASRSTSWSWAPTPARARATTSTAESADGERSDTTILLHVSADRKHAYGVSLPRDAIVDRPDCIVPRRDHAGRDGRHVQHRVLRRRRAVHGADRRGAHRHLHRPLPGRSTSTGSRTWSTPSTASRSASPRTSTTTSTTSTSTPAPRCSPGRTRSTTCASATCSPSTGDIGRMKRQQAFIASMVNKVMSAGTLSQPHTRLSASSTPPPPRSRSTTTSTRRASWSTWPSEFQRHRAGQDQVHHRADRGVRARPQPADLDRRGRRRCGSGSSADQPLGQDFSEDSIGADDPVGTTDRGTRHSEQGTDAGPSAPPQRGSAPERSDAEHAQPWLRLGRAVVEQAVLTRANDESPGRLACGSSRVCTPDRIRTGATAVRGRRARPLHNGGLS